MRCFIAVVLESRLVNKVMDIQKQIRNSGADVKFVETENLHFTLKFLDELNENEIGEVRDELKKYIDNEEVFSIKIAGLGCFGRNNHIRTLWLGVKSGEDKFMKLLENVNKIKFGKINRKIHLTIGRVRSPRNIEKLIHILNSLKDVNIGEMDVNVVKLKSSELTRSGPMYSDLAVFRLKGNENE